MITLLLLSSFASASAGDLQQRLDEVAPYRTYRVARGVPDIPAEAYESVAEGKVETGLVSVDGAKARKAWGVGIVDVSIERYWAAINDETGKVEHTRLDFVKLLEGDFCDRERKVFQYLPVSLASDRWWVSTITQNPEIQRQSGGKVREMRWLSHDDFDVSADPEIAQKASGGIRTGSTEGAWLLVDLGDGRTLVEYYAWSDPGGSIPAAMASRFAAGSIPNTLESMAELAKKGPRCAFE